VDRRGARGCGVGRRGIEAIARLLPCLVAAIALLTSGCSATRPSRLNDVCAIFAEQPDWLEDAQSSYEKWGVPVPIQLAVIHQESRFEADSRPPRGTFLWIFPGARPSSAYGYGQILDATWDHYVESSGSFFSDRDDFADVTDFIGWYGSLGERRYGIPKTDPFAFYLAYHEGHTGYVRGTYKRNARLLEVAGKVANLSRQYQRQLEVCEPEMHAGRSTERPRGS
jgi:hypothetical protein